MSAVEEYILKRIQLRLIRLSVSGEVEHFYQGRWRIKKPHQHEKSLRYRYVFEYPPTNKLKGTRISGTVYRNRLVWMISNRRAIPDGFYVDHKDTNRLNDHPDNLQLMSISDSHLQGNVIQSQSILESLLQWFEFVGRYGREPVTENELLYGF